MEKIWEHINCRNDFDGKLKYKCDGFSGKIADTWRFTPGKNMGTSSINIGFFMKSRDFSAAFPPILCQPSPEILPGREPDPKSQGRQQLHRQRRRLLLSPQSRLQRKWLGAGDLATLQLCNRTKTVNKHICLYPSIYLSIHLSAYLSIGKQ